MSGEESIITNESKAGRSWQDTQETERNAEPLFCLSPCRRQVLITGWRQRDTWSSPLWKNDWRISRVCATKALQTLCQTSGLSLETLNFRYCWKYWCIQGLLFFFTFSFISHFLSYCNKIFPLQPESEITVAARKLKELFEKHLRIIFPDQTFPEIKLEMLSDFPSEFMSWQYVRACQQVCLTLTQRAFPVKTRQ